MGKYLFFDIDGTLIGKSGRITDKTKWALGKAREKGHKVFLCTGRVPASIVGDVTEIETDGTISGAGSFVELEDRYIFEHYMEPELTGRVRTLFEENGLSYTLECRDVIYQTPGAREFFERANAARNQDNPEVMRYREQLNKKRNLKRIAEYDSRVRAAKMCFIAEREEQLRACLPLLEPHFNVVIFSKSSDPYVNGEIILKGCTKGDAVRRVMEYYGESMEETIGFGDSMNDYQMLKAVKTSVAFTGAEGELRTVASYYFEEPDQDGIYKVMTELGLV